MKPAMNHIGSEETILQGASVAMPSEINDEDNDSSEESASDENGSRWHVRAWLYGITTVLAILFAAARATWSQGMVLVLMGVTISLAPPHFNLRRVPALALIWLALAPGVGLLPAKWFGSLEAWRIRLVTEWSLPLSNSISPEIWTTLESWFVMLACVVWFWSCLGQNFSDGGRRMALRILALAAMFIAIVSLMEFWHVMSVPWWPRSLVDGLTTGLGPFSNRNHTSSFFAFSSVLCAAAAYDAFRKRSRWWLVLVPGVVLMLVCIMLNTSRAGLILFFIGILLWLATAAMRKGFLRKTLVSTAVILTVASVVLVSGAHLGERLKAQPISESIGRDLRWWLAEETLTAVVNAPWIGRGLGLFEKIFPLVSSKPYPNARPLHPESDVLWLLFEGGMLTLVPCLLLVFWLWSSTGPWFSQRRKKSLDSRSGRRIRKAFAIAASLPLVHAFFDVPLHGLSYFLTIAFVASMAVRPRYLGSLTGPLETWLFRIAGLLIAIIGFATLAIGIGLTDRGLAATAPFLNDKAVVEAGRGNRAEAMALISRAIDLTPLDFRPYVLRAQLHLNMRHSTEYALLDYGRARAVETSYGPMCIDEGLYWLHFDPGMALIPWREALRRYSADGSWAMFAQYSGMLGNFAAYPEHHLSIWRLADQLPMQLFCLNQFTQSPHWPTIFKEFLAEHPGLDDLTENQVLFLVEAWQRRGEKTELLSYVKKSSRLSNIAWRLIASDLAQAGKFEPAFRLAALHILPAVRSTTLSASDIPRLERTHLLNPLDILPGIELYYAQRSSGDIKTARQTLEKVMRIPLAPDFLKREMAAVLAASGDTRGAWDLMLQIINAAPVETSAMYKDLQADDGLKRPKAPPPRRPGSEF